MVASKKIFDHTPSETSNTSNGHSLLSFMNLASNKVKSALEKPNSFKRNINHRRFLQKQFRAMVKSPEKNTGRKSLGRGNGNAISLMLGDCDQNRHTFPPPLHHNNALQFDPLGTSVPNLGFEMPVYGDSFSRNEPFATGQCLRRPDESNVTARGCTTQENNNCLYQTACCSSIPELVVEEDFLTGEELTQAIELKDLFVPDTDLTQYFWDGKENVRSFCNNDASIECEGWPCRDFGPKDDILVF